MPEELEDDERKMHRMVAKVKPTKSLVSTVRTTMGRSGVCGKASGVRPRAVAGLARPAQA